VNREKSAKREQNDGTGRYGAAGMAEPARRAGRTAAEMRAKKIRHAAATQCAVMPSPYRAEVRAYYHARWHGGTPYGERMAAHTLANANQKKGGRCAAGRAVVRQAGGA